MANPYNNPYGLRTPTRVASKQPQLNEFQKGFRRFVGGVSPTIDRVQAGAQDLLGMEAAAEANRQEARAAEEALTQDQRLAPRVGRVENIGSFSDALDWGAYTLGSNLPLMGSMALTGVAGGAAGRLLGSTKLGATAGAAVPYAGQVGGENLRRLDKNPNIDVSDPGVIGGAALTTAGQTALGMMPIVSGARMLRGPGTRLQKAGRLAGASALAEAGTEASEEYLGRSLENYFDPTTKMFGPEARSDYLNAAVAGGFLGGTMGGLAGFAAPRNAMQTAVEEGRDPGEAFNQFLGENQGLYDDNELVSLADQAASWAPTEARGPIQRRIDELEAQDELNVKFSNVLGISDKEYALQEAARKNRATAGAKQQWAKTEEKLALYELFDQLIDGEIDPNSIQVQRVIQTVGPRRFQTMFKQFAKGGSVDTPDAQAKQVVDDRREQYDAERTDELLGNFDEDNAFESSMAPDKFADGLSVEEAQAPSYEFNRNGQPWTFDAVNSASAAAKKRILGELDVDAQERYAAGEITNEELLANSRYRPVSLRTALEAEARAQVGVDKKEYVTREAQRLLQTSLEDSITTDGEVKKGKEGKIAEYERYTNDIESYLDEAYVLERQNIPSAFDPERSDLVTQERLEGVKNPKTARRLAELNEELRQIEAEYDTLVYGGQDTELRKEVYSKYRGIDKSATKAEFAKHPQNAEIIASVEAAQRGERAQELNEYIKDQKERINKLAYQDKGVVRADKGKMKSRIKRIPVRLISTDPAQRAKKPKGVTKLLDVSEAARASFAEIPFDPDATRDVTMRRVANGIAGIIGGRTRNYEVDWESIPDNTVVYARKDAAGRDELIKWGDLKEYFPTPQKTSTKRPIRRIGDTRSLSDASRETASQKKFAEDRVPELGEGVEATAGKGRPLPTKEGLQTTGGLAKDAGRYDIELEYEEQSNATVGLEKRLDALVGRAERLSNKLKEGSTVSPGRSARLEADLKELRSEWLALKQKQENPQKWVMQGDKAQFASIRDLYREARANEAPQTDLDALEKDARLIQKVFEDRMADVQKRAEVIKRQLESPNATRRKLSESERKAAKSMLKGVLQEISDVEQMIAIELTKRLTYTPPNSRAQQVKRNDLFATNKIISGGQTGADIGGLVAAERLGMALGGTGPKGWKTEKGAQPILGSRFGLKESSSADYSVRTKQNVLDADATVIFTSRKGWKSRGSQQTIGFAEDNGKPYIQIDPFAATAQRDLAAFLNKHRPMSLNIAGNRESVSPGIANRVVKLLEQTFTNTGKVDRPAEPKRENRVFPQKKQEPTKKEKEQRRIAEARKKESTATRNLRQLAENRQRFRQGSLKFSKVPGAKVILQAERPAQTEKLQEMTNKLVKRLGLPELKIISAEEGLAFIEKHSWDALEINGFNDGNRIYVNPRLPAAAQKATLAHEVGHVVMRELWGTASKRTKTSIINAHKAWVKEQGNATVKGVLKARNPKELFEYIDKEFYVEAKVSDMMDHQQEYLLDFEEWFSDQVGRWFMTDAQPRTALQQFFKHVADVVKDLFKGLYPDRADKHVRKYLDSLVRGEPAKASQVGAPKMSKVESTAAQFGPGWHTLDAQVAWKPISAALEANEKVLLERMVQKNFIRRQLASFYERDAAVLNKLDNNMTEELLPHMYMAWRAGKLDVSRRQHTILRSAMAEVADSLGVRSDEKNAEALMAEIAKGTAYMRGVRPTVVQLASEDTALQRGRLALARASEPVVDWTMRLAGTAEMQMRRAKNPALTEMWRLVYAAPDTAGGKGGFFAARNTMRGEFTTALHKIYDGKDQAFGERMADLLNGVIPESEANAAEKKALRQTRSLLDQMYKYMIDAGMTVGKVENYFRRVYDANTLSSKGSEFIEMLVTKYPEELAKYAKAKKPMTEAELKQTATRIYNALVFNSGEEVAAAEAIVREETNDPLGWPAAPAIQERTLGWIKQEDVAPYLSKDLGLTMSTYIDQTVKRAEYNRRFGYGTGRKTINAYLEEAKQKGATPQQLQMAENAMQAAVGTLGADINPTLHKVQGFVLMLQNWMLLGLATITSLVDPMGMSVRGDFESAWTGLKAGIATVKAELNGDPNELKQLAEMLGVNELHGTIEALGYEYGGYYLTGTARRWNDRLFSINLLNQWTRLTRVMALAAGRHFIRKHSSFEYNKHSERYMQELGLRKGDIRFGEDGQIEVLSDEKRDELRENKGGKSGQELDRDDRVRNALTRFVDESILRPDSAQRPIWASDPHYMLLFHLKAFTYSFHERILRRVGYEISEGNMMPAVALMGYLPLMFIAEALRNGLQGDDLDDSIGKDAGFFETTHYIAQRAGVYGLGQLYFDAQRDMRFGDAPLAPPAIEHALTIGEAAFSDSEADDWRAFQRSLPFSNLHADWFE